MSRYVLVTLLVPVVLWNIMEVLATNDDGALHLIRHDNPRKDTTTDRDIAGKRTFLDHDKISNASQPEKSRSIFKKTRKDKTTHLVDVSSFNGLCKHNRERVKRV